jgi:hypothetical protein
MPRMDRTHALEPDRGTQEAWLEAASRFVFDHLAGLASAPAVGVVGAEGNRIAAEVSVPIPEAPLPGGIAAALDIVGRAVQASLETLIGGGAPLEIVATPQLTITAFRLQRRFGEMLSQWNARNAALLAAINGYKRVYLSSTTLPVAEGDAFTLRVCVLSFRTHAPNPVVKRGKTPVLTREETRELLDSCAQHRTRPVALTRTDAPTARVSHDLSTAAFFAQVGSAAAPGTRAFRRRSARLRQGSGAHAATPPTLRSNLAKEGRHRHHCLVRPPKRAAKEGPRERRHAGARPTDLSTEGLGLHADLSAEGSEP